MPARKRPNQSGKQKQSEPMQQPSTPTIRRHVGLMLGGLAVTCVLMSGYRWANYGSTSSVHAKVGRGPEPLVYSYKVIKEYPHATDAFTQGLLFAADGKSLYESTGMYKRTQVRRLDRETGAVLQSTDAGDKAFGEGLMLWQDRLLQLNWQKNTGFVYNSSTFDKSGTLQHPYRDGWGFTGSPRSDEEFTMTDNGHDLLFVRPTVSTNQKDVVLTEVGRMPVHDQGAYVTMLNELEMIGGEIFANIFGKDCIARINPADGTVSGWILMDGILKEPVPDRHGNNVLNGIAFDPSNPSRIFVTGKEWPKMYEIELQPSSVSVASARRVCIPTRNIFTGWHQPAQ